MTVTSMVTILNTRQVVRSRGFMAVVAEMVATKYIIIGISLYYIEYDVWHIVVTYLFLTMAYGASDLSSIVVIALTTLVRIGVGD